MHFKQHCIITPHPLNYRVNNFNTGLDGHRLFLLKDKKTVDGHNILLLVEDKELEMLEHHSYTTSM